MKNLWVLCLALVMTAAGCGGPSTAQENFRDAVAVEMTLATMVDGAAPAPSPYRCARCRDTGWLTHGDGHRTPCPDCQSGSAGDLYGGPIDTLRQARELIEKGNSLADRGKAILDAAERDGKITVDVRIPKPAPYGSPAACPDGFCPLPSARAIPPATAARPTTVYYAPARPRLFLRRR